MFKCVFCGNKDPTSFGLNGNTYYCKKCITFKGDAVVLTAGVPAPNFNSSGECITNMMRVAVIR